MKFSRNANSALKIAREYAGKYNSKNVGTEHLLIGLIECKDATLTDTFKKLDVETSQIADIVNSILHIDQINKSTSGSKKLEFTPRVVKIIEFAKGIAQKLNKHNVHVPFCLHRISNQSLFSYSKKLLEENLDILYVLKKNFLINYFHQHLYKALSPHQ